MFAEIGQLNRLYKTNDFSMIKPRVYQDRLIYMVEKIKPEKMTRANSNALKQLKEPLTEDYVL